MPRKKDVSANKPTKETPEPIVIKEIPNTEESLVVYVNHKHLPCYRLTREYFTDRFMLYKIVEDGFLKIGEGETPYELEEKYVNYK